MEKARKATAKASRSIVCLDSRRRDIKAAKAKARVSLKARKDKAKEEERKVMEKASPLLCAGTVVRLVILSTCAIRILIANR